MSPCSAPQSLSTKQGLEPFNYISARALALVENKEW